MITTSVIKKHYEKVVIACCFLFFCVNIGFVSTSFSVYQPYIVAVPGVGNTGGSMLLAFRTFISLVCMLLVAKFYNLVDCRVGIFLACMCTAAGFVIYSFSDNFWLFMLGGLFAGAGYGLGGMVGMTLLVSRWFKGHVGAALGIAATGSSFASFVLPIIVTHIIETSSLFWAFLMEAVLALLIGFMVLALLRNYPSDMSMQPYEGKVKAGKKPQRVGAAKSLPPTPRMLMCLAMIFMGCIAVDAWAYLSILMTSSGFNPYFAATLLTAAGIAMAVAKVVSGSLFDALGVFKGSIIMFAVMNLGLLFCCFAGMHNAIVMTLGAVLLGAGICLGSVGISIWSIDLSTVEERVKLVKDLQVAYAFGGFVFNFLPGALMDVLGTYAVSYVILLAMGLVEMAIVVGIYMKVVNSR